MTDSLDNTLALLDRLSEQTREIIAIQNIEQKILADSAELKKRVTRTDERVRALESQGLLATKPTEQRCNNSKGVMACDNCAVDAGEPVQIYNDEKLCKECWMILTLYDMRGGRAKAPLYWDVVSE